MALTIECRAKWIVVRGSGSFTLDEVRRHFCDLSAALGRRRLTGGGERVLVDMRDFSVQTREVSDCIAEGMEIAYRGSTHVALVVSSALLKLQVSRIHSSPNTRIFTSLEEAEDYLVGTFGEGAG